MHDLLFVEAQRFYVVQVEYSHWESSARILGNRPAQGRLAVEQPSPIVTLGSVVGRDDISPFAVKYIDIVWAQRFDLSWIACGSLSLGNSAVRKLSQM